MRIKRRRNKYNNKRAVVDGIAFHSRKEAARYQELKLMEKADLLCDLRLQYPFKFEIEGKLIFKYLADFRYFDIKANEYVVEDAKGFRTGIYKLKKKIIEANHGITIREV